jgi:hypothetical protein
MSMRIVLPVSSKITNAVAQAEDESYLAALLVGDGRPLLALFALGLGLAGAFAWFLSAVGEALPHELRFLGLTLDQLRALAGGRVMDFMIHDRVAFGGTLLAMSVVYLWLIAGPLGHGERWAWWLIAITGSFGFASFAAYAGSGYIDTWHLAASAALVTAFVPGLVLTHRRLRPGRGPGSLVAWASWRTLPGLGRRLVALTGIGMVVAGTVILVLGSIVVFVPQDIIYIGFDRSALDEMNSHLVPLVAHDRTGFGGGVATMGLLVLGCVAFARWTVAVWQALAVAGLIGFGAAIGVHGMVGYLDASHVGPAVAGAIVFLVGMWLSRPWASVERLEPSPSAHRSTRDPAGSEVVVRS